MKSFLITIDTEGDNLWEWSEGKKIQTENAMFLQRFQELCNQFDYKPVWLSNYEMMSDARYVDFVAETAEMGKCEIGMHLHAWNTPPLMKLEKKYAGAPYLIEYSREIMIQKIETMTELIIQRTGVKPVSHRAGRWATNDKYFEILQQYGYIADCSVTPTISWHNTMGCSNNSHGSNYTHSSKKAYYIFNNPEKPMIEIPMSIRNKRVLKKPDSASFLDLGRLIKRSVVGKKIWLRPNGNNRDELIQLIDIVNNEPDNDYLMFMLHSSELMPGGSPAFQDEKSIDRLYDDIKAIFESASRFYAGETMREYAMRFINSNKGIDIDE